eukprot:3872929-Prymnesium_polylepis.1
MDGGASARRRVVGQQRRAQVFDRKVGRRLGVGRGVRVAKHPWPCRSTRRSRRQSARERKLRGGRTLLHGEFADLGDPPLRRVAEARAVVHVAVIEDAHRHAVEEHRAALALGARAAGVVTALHMRAFHARRQELLALCAVHARFDRIRRSARDRVALQARVRILGDPRCRTGTSA